MGRHRQSRLYAYWFCYGGMTFCWMVYSSSYRAGWGSVEQEDVEPAACSADIQLDSHSGEQVSRALSVDVPWSPQGLSLFCPYLVVALNPARRTNV